MIQGLIICSVTLTKQYMYFKTSLSTVKQSQVTQLLCGKQEQPKMGFPPPTCVTRDCLTVVKLVLKYIYRLVSVTQKIFRPCIIIF